MSDLSEATITIIITIHPLKKNARRVDVAAAPAGEMPILLTGNFAQRHTLADQCYAALLKRKPQVVKGANGTSKKSAKAAQDLSEPEASAMDEAIGEHLAEDTATETGPIGPVLETTSPAVDTDSEPLPIIEGDESPIQLTLTETDNG